MLMAQLGSWDFNVPRLTSARGLEAASAFGNLGEKKGVGGIRNPLMIRLR